MSIISFNSSALITRENNGIENSKPNPNVFSIFSSVSIEIILLKIDLNFRITRHTLSSKSNISAVRYNLKNY